MAPAVIEALEVMRRHPEIEICDQHSLIDNTQGNRSNK